MFYVMYRIYNQQIHLHRNASPPGPRAPAQDAVLGLPRPPEVQHRKQSPLQSRGVPSRLRVAASTLAFPQNESFHRERDSESKRERERWRANKREREREVPENLHKSYPFARSAATLCSKILGFNQSERSECGGRTPAWLPACPSKGQRRRRSRARSLLNGPAVRT